MNDTKQTMEFENENFGTSVFFLPLYLKFKKKFYVRSIVGQSCKKFAEFLWAEKISNKKYGG